MQALLKIPARENPRQTCAGRLGDWQSCREAVNDYRPRRYRVIFATEPFVLKFGCEVLL